jgi:acetyl esterase/lipase
MEFRYSPLPNPKHRLDIYIPQQPKQDMPLLVFIHGGAWRTGDKKEYAFIGEFLAERGICTVLPSYPLTTSKGENPHPSHLKSVALAISWAFRYSSFYTGIPYRSMVLSGHSAGAYMAAKLCLEPQYLEAVGGKELIHAMVGWMGIDGIYNIPKLVDSFPGYLSFIEPAFSNDRNEWISSSVHPTYFKGPCLLIHAKDDELVNMEQTTDLYQELLGMNCQVVFESEFTGGHDNMLKSHSFLSRLAQFVNECRL